MLLRKDIKFLFPKNILGRNNKAPNLIQRSWLKEYFYFKAEVNMAVNVLNDVHIILLLEIQQKTVGKASQNYLRKFHTRAIFKGRNGLTKGK